MSYAFTKMITTSPACLLDEWKRKALEGKIETQNHKNNSERDRGVDIVKGSIVAMSFCFISSSLLTHEDAYHDSFTRDSLHQGGLVRRNDVPRTHTTSDSSSETCFFHVQEHFVLVVYCRPLQHTFPKL